jgi:hypothetical protein
MRGVRLMALGQGAALIGLGAWPIASMSTFERVTGPKHDDWLVRTVGGLCIAIGTGLVAGSGRPTSVRPLGVATAATFLATDVIGFRSGRLRPVYLLDAVAEGAIIAGWAAATIPDAAPRVARRLRRILRGRPGRPFPSTPSALVHPSEPRAMHAHVVALLDEARHVARQAWPGSTPPPTVAESLRRLTRSAERLEEAVADDGALDPVELRRLARLTATASADAASIQEAAFLVSS